MMDDLNGLRVGNWVSHKGLDRCRVSVIDAISGELWLSTDDPDTSGFVPVNEP
jgi:hypothetical protein